MKISRRLFLILPLCLAACGFQPIYERQHENEPLLSSVRVAKVPGRSGQLFQADLEDQLNPNALKTEPAYEVRTVLGMRLEPLSINIDATISSYRVVFDSSMAIVDLRTKKVIHSERIKRNNRYSVNQAADYATYTAEQDAIERGAEDLSQEYFLEIAAFLKHYDPNAASNAKAPNAPPLPPTSGYGIAPTSPAPIVIVPYAPDAAAAEAGSLSPTTPDPETTGDGSNILAPATQGTLSGQVQ